MKWQITVASAWKAVVMVYHSFIKDGTRSFCWPWGRDRTPLIVICKTGGCASVRSGAVEPAFFIILLSSPSISTDATSRMC